jgi:hypothetical protein
MRGINHRTIERHYNEGYCLGNYRMQFCTSATEIVMFDLSAFFDRVKTRAILTARGLNELNAD